jgi:hypothetical protein
MDDEIEYSLPHFALCLILGFTFVMIGSIYGLGFIGNIFMYFETYFHEMSHALVTLFLNGNVNEIVINEDSSGHCLSAHFTDGPFVLIAMAGYLGASIFGCLLFFSERIFKGNKYHFKSALLSMIFISFFYLRLEWTTFFITFFIFVCFVYFFFQKSNLVETLFLKTIGLTIMIGACVSPLVLLDIHDGDALIVHEITGYAYNSIVYFWNFFAIFILSFSLIVEHLILTKKEGTYVTR